jgi:hypothetical protein
MEAEYFSGRLLFLFNGLLEQSIDDLDHFVVHGTVAGDGLEQRNRNDFVGAQGGHASEFAAMHHVDGAQAIARGQNAIEGAGRAAALNVSEDDGAGFIAGTFFDFAGEDVGDAAELDVAEREIPDRARRKILRLRLRQQ